MEVFYNQVVKTVTVNQKNHCIFTRIQFKKKEVFKMKELEKIIG